MLRVAFFGSAGTYSAAHLDAVTRVHEVVGTFCAMGQGWRGRANRLLRATGLRDDPFNAVVRDHGLTRWFTTRDAGPVAAQLATLKPDVVCAAGYPWLLPSSICALAPHGGINSHPSLLPRHRGVLPLFWIYYHDDRQTGVSIHRMSDVADGGDLIGQERFDMERGLPVEQLNDRNARVGGRLLTDALNQIATDDVRDVPQQATLATAAPYVRPGSPMVDFAWDVERVWHFLSGLFPWFIEPLRSPEGLSVKYSRVLGYERMHNGAEPGTIEHAGVNIRLHCAGGVVHLAAAFGRRH